MNSGVSAVVLAAGSSSRMGAIKQLMCVAGTPMLERVLTVLNESALDEVVVVLGHSAELIQQAIQFRSEKVVLNSSYREGIASSLRAGIANVSANAEAALITLADQPFLKATTVDQLIRQYHRHKPQIAVPIYEGIRGNPVLLDRSVFKEAAVLTGDAGFRTVFARYAGGILKVPVDDQGILADLDTEADVKKWASPEAK